MNELRRSIREIEKRIRLAKADYETTKQGSKRKHFGKRSKKMGDPYFLGVIAGLAEARVSLKIQLDEMPAPKRSSAGKITSGVK